MQLAEILKNPIAKIPALKASREQNYTVTHRIPNRPIFERSFSDTFCVRFSNGGSHLVLAI
jgi:hypothetical protein